MIHSQPPIIPTLGGKNDVCLRVRRPVSSTYHQNTKKSSPNRYESCPTFYIYGAPERHSYARGCGGTLRLPTHCCRDEKAFLAARCCVHRTHHDLLEPADQTQHTKHMGHPKHRSSHAKQHSAADTQLRNKHPRAGVRGQGSGGRGHGRFCYVCNRL